MKTQLFLISAIILTVLNGLQGYCQTHWKELTTVEDVYTHYPDRLKELFQAINLEYQGLEPVRGALEKKDTLSASRLLLAYYKNEKRSPFSSIALPKESRKKIPEAEDLVEGIFTFYEQPSTIPHQENGHLQWNFQGPANDMEWAWALNRHYHINVLFNAYLETGNPVYAKTIDQHIKDWVISADPYPSQKSSTAMWRGLEVSFRVKSWAEVFYSLIQTDYLSPATQLLMLSSLPDHAHYARNFHAQGNWLTMEISGLARLATAWPEFKGAPEWIAYAKATMAESLEEQIYPDGVQTELTSSYHQVALNNFNQFLKICQEVGEELPESFLQQIEQMWSYIAYTIRPDGYGLLNNDADKKYNRDEVQQAASQFRRADWNYIASNGKVGLRPSGPPSKFYPWAGHLISRSDYDKNAHWSFFDMGPWGTGHQHNDKLHLSIAAFGRDLLVDSGRFAYRGELADKFRRYALGSIGHNVILIDGKGQDAGPKLSTQPIDDNHYKITEEWDYAWSSFDQFKGLAGEAVHTRTVFYLRGEFWIVLDRISTDRPRKLEALWHWHPASSVEKRNKGEVGTMNEKGNLLIQPLGLTDWDIELIKGQELPYPQGWYSESYNKVEPNTASVFSAEISEDAAMVWVLYPSEKSSPAIQARILSQDKNGVKLHLTNEWGEQWTLTVPFEDSTQINVQKITSK